MSILISNKIKSKILQFIDDNSLENSFNSSFIEKALHLKFHQLHIVIL